MGTAPVIEDRRGYLAARLLEALGAEGAAEARVKAAEKALEIAENDLFKAQQEVIDLERQLGFEGGEPEYLALLEGREL
jgi:glycosyltransferase A (GT-A) superfamily protein (DUF2064 family)